MHKLHALGDAEHPSELTSGIDQASSLLDANEARFASQGGSDAKLTCTGANV